MLRVEEKKGIALTTGNWAGIVVVATLLILSISTRLLPLSISPLPFNNDGLTESRIASDILLSGHLSYPDGIYYEGTHSTVTPIFDMLIAFVSSVIGSPPLSMAQFVVAAIAPLTVIGGYLICLKLTAGRRFALLGGLTLGLLGTFLYLTGSAWKESIGFGLYVLLFYSYMKRSDPKMLAVEISVLAVLPMVHHLVTLIAYISVGYLTVWSLIFALRGNGLEKRNIVDSTVILSFSAVALLYYRGASFDSLSRLQLLSGVIPMALVFVIVCILIAAVLSMRRHTKFSFAPIPALVAFGVFSWNHFFPLFPYAPGSSWYVLLLAGSLCLLVYFAWIGFEDVIESNSMFRAIPLGMLLPVITLSLFAFISGLSLSGHQILYRSLDFADLALAAGIAVSMKHSWKRTRGQAIVAGAVVCALLVSFPFGYATESLIGVRHDTQNYEADAVEWLTGACGSWTMVQSDERVSYIAMALGDFEKMPWLPERLQSDGMLGVEAYYILEHQWFVEGVDDYPRGHPTLNETKTTIFLGASNVVYIGGPSDNQLTVFCASTWGQEKIYGYPE